MDKVINGINPEITKRVKYQSKKGLEAEVIRICEMLSKSYPNNISFEHGTAKEDDSNKHLSEYDRNMEARSKTDIILKIVDELKIKYNGVNKVVIKSINKTYKISLKEAFTPIPKRVWEETFNLPFEVIGDLLIIDYQEKNDLQTGKTNTIIYRSNLDGGKCYIYTSLEEFNKCISSDIYLDNEGPPVGYKEKILIRKSDLCFENIRQAIHYLINKERKEILEDYKKQNAEVKAAPVSKYKMPNYKGGYEVILNRIEVIK